MPPSYIASCKPFETYHTSTISQFSMFFCPISVGPVPIEIGGTSPERLETLREELPAEVQRLQKSWEEKWQQQMEAGEVTWCET
jgi:hypothetical protein